MAGADELTDLERSFSEVALELFASGTVEGTLQHIADLAERTVDGCAGAGIFVMDAVDDPTVAASNPMVRVIDRLQLDAGEGPCLDAASSGKTCYAIDLTVESPWPTFSPAAVEKGIRCVLAYSLSSERQSALNLYAHLPAAFGATGRAQGQLFATLARLALDSAEERAASEKRTGNLHEAMRTRELIGQAQGILMERERITAEQAFDVLRRASQHMNVKLREVARTLVETGEAPAVRAADPNTTTRPGSAPVPVEGADG